MVNRRLLEAAIIEQLSRNGASEISQILSFLRDRFPETSEDELNKSLLTLEVRGLLRVYSSQKDKQRVELVKG